MAHRLRDDTHMTDSPEAAVAGAVRWTCPFCPLLCDHLGVRVAPSGRTLEPAGGDCARARAGLAHFAPTPSAARPRVDGRECELDEAVRAAARILKASRQPLFGGLGTDVAGARALYRLACATGAISDVAHGAALTQGLRALQDRGGFTTTLSEVRARADLVVFLGGLAREEAPNLLDRLGFGDPAVAQRHAAVIGPTARDDDGLANLAGRRGASVESIALHGDLFDTVALLAALVQQRRVPQAPAPLVALAVRLRAARYAVVVGNTATLPAHAALLIEAVGRIVGSLNIHTRAAALWLGGGNGAATVNQVFTWLSGLPLRSRAGPAGLEHEPVCFDARRLIDDAAVDSLLWVSSFDAETRPPLTSVPLVVLGHPELGCCAERPGSVFIPVSTPGVGSAGHLFRTDGVVLLPLFPVYADTLPTVAEVTDRIWLEVRV
jgi:formylmethanofuran dehydrogenase subunit B